MFMGTIGRICFVFCILITGCGEEQIYKVGLRGSLIGYVNSYGNLAVPAGLSDAEVTLEGTDPLVTRNTNSNGKFEVSDLQTGTYNLIFNKAGYGTFKILGYSFVGGDVAATAPSVMLYPLPNIEINDASVAVTRYGDAAYGAFTVFTETSEPAVRSGYFRYYLSKEPDVSSMRYLETGILGSYSQTGSHNMQTSFDVNRFAPGSNLYLVIYPCTEQFANYLDIETGKKIYCSVGESNTGVITITIPN